MEHHFTNMYYQKISPWLWLCTENFYMLCSEESCLPPGVRLTLGALYVSTTATYSPTFIITCRLSSLYVKVQGLNFVFSCPRSSIWRKIKKNPCHTLKCTVNSTCNPRPSSCRGPVETERHSTKIIARSLSWSNRFFLNLTPVIYFG